MLKGLSQLLLLKEGNHRLESKASGSKTIGYLKMMMIY
jgi:hypothetical protein